MPRNIPICPDRPQPSLSVVKKLYNIQIATLLIGGGTSSGENDLITPIRGSEVRGQLRFWWRAVRGMRFNNTAELYKEEEKIWGSSKSPSKVGVYIKEVNVRLTERWAEYQTDKEGRVRGFPTPKEENFPAYALFPYQGETEGRPREVVKQPSTAIWDAIFTLEISFPEDLSLDVEASWWAWVNFGGIGARTRRGCGGLYCEDWAAPADIAQIPNWYREKLQRYTDSIPSISVGWPILPETILIKEEMNIPMKAWKNVIDLLHEFRQGEKIGRNPGRGRSRWPEADSLRLITGYSHPNHSIPITIRGNNNTAFPRAELGLPIIFHFKDHDPRYPNNRRKDPPDSELYPTGSQRMSSPLILKPLVLKGGKAVPMIMRLITPPLQDVELKKTQGATSPYGVGHIRHPRLTRYPNSPMKGLSSTGSALEAFMNFAKGKGYK